MTSNSSSVGAAEPQLAVTELFHDQGYIYLSPIDPSFDDDITVRLRAEIGGIDSAEVQYSANGSSWKTVSLSHEPDADNEYFEFWSGVIPAQTGNFYYRFRCRKNGSTVYYHIKGITSSAPAKENCFMLMPGYDAPEWAQGALWYSAMPDAFYNGDVSNDKGISGSNTVRSWNNIHKQLDDKYGGDLSGLSEKLEYIKELGVNAVFVNPVAASTQNAGYGTIDFKRLESSFGNAETMRQFSETLHEQGLRLMVDVVLAFSPVNSYWFNRSGIWPEAGFSQSNTDISAFFQYPNFNFLTDEQARSAAIEFYEKNGYYSLWGGASHNLSNQTLQDYFYRDDDSYLQYFLREFDVDAYRFDCGGSLFGVEEDGSRKNEGTIIGEIRPYLRSIKDDVMLLSEWSGSSITDGGWDSRWNLNVMYALRSFVTGEPVQQYSNIGEEELLSALDSEVRRLPRDLALCLYNMLVSHDVERIERTEENADRLRAAQLILLTYLGAPCIFYGDEIGLYRASGRSFYAMEWDESQWQQDTLCFYRAMGELRNTYDAVKTGVYRQLITDHDTGIFAFGRWNENGAAITVANSNSFAATAVIETKLLDIADGTVITDWLTGSRYTAANGRITVTVPAGGSVLVTGEESSSYRDAYVISAIGDTTVTGVQMTDTGDFVLTGGQDTVLGETCDRVTFVNRTAFDDVALSAVLTGGGTLMLRSSLADSAVYYAASVTASRLHVTARTAAGTKAVEIAAVPVNDGIGVRILRDAQNQFKTYYTDQNGGYILLPEATVSFFMPDQILAGAASLSAGTNVRGLSCTELDGKLWYDDFESGISGPLFSDAGDLAAVTNGCLTVTAGEEPTELTAATPQDDWTFKAKLGPVADGSEGGVIARADKNQYIALLRGADGLHFGRYTGGKFAMFYAETDIRPGEDILLQLQRIGTVYTAVFSYDGCTWYPVGGEIDANYSLERAGLIVSCGSITADYVSFGDAVNDGLSVNSPRTPGIIDVSYETTANAVTVPAYRYESGSWSYSEEGFFQSDVGVAPAVNLGDNEVSDDFDDQYDGETSGVLSVYNKKFTDFVAETTLKIDAGSGYAGIGFGLSEPAQSTAEDYLMRLTSNGVLQLCENGKVVGRAAVGKGEIRTTLVVRGGRILVFAGQNATLLFAYDSSYTGGYVNYRTQGVAAHFNNFNLGDLAANWYTTGSTAGTASDLYLTGTDEKLASLVKVGLTDFILTGEITVSVAETGEQYATLLFCGSQGQTPAQSGIGLTLDGSGRLSLAEGSRLLDSCTLVNNTHTVKVLVIKRSGKIEVYVNNELTPALTYEEPQNRGGTVAFYSNGTSAQLKDLHIAELSGDDDPSGSELYLIWKNNASYKNSTVKPVVEGFDSTALTHQMTVYQGTWEQTGGVLKCLDTSDKAGIAVDGVYKDCEISFDCRFNSASSGYLALALHKRVKDEAFVAGSLTLTISQENGRIALYKSGSTVASYNSWDFRTGIWVRNIRVVCKGDSVKVYYNNECVIAYQDPSSSEGYITLNSSAALCSFDNISVLPLMEQTEPDPQEAAQVVKEPCLQSGETDRTGEYLQNHQIGLLSGEEVTITNVIPGSQFALAAQLEIAPQAGDGGLIVGLGSGNYFGRDAEVIAAVIADAVGSGCEVGIGLMIGERTVWLSKWYQRAAFPASFTVEYENGYLRIFLGGAYAQHYEVNIAASGLTGFVPALRLAADGAQITLADIQIFGDVSAMLPTVTVAELSGGYLLVDRPFAAPGETVTVTVVPDDGYLPVAGSLRTFDGSDYRYITDAVDGSRFRFIMPENPVQVSIQLLPRSLCGVSLANLWDETVASDGVRPDGVRFLTRMYLDMPQADPQDGIYTVFLDGEIYTVRDYGTLVALAGSYSGALTVDGNAKRVSAKQGKICLANEYYIDFAVTVRIPPLTGVPEDYYNSYYARSYTVRAYVCLEDAAGEIRYLYGNEYTAGYAA